MQVIMLASTGEDSLETLSEHSHRIFLRGCAEISSSNISMTMGIVATENIVLLKVMNKYLVILELCRPEISFM